MQHELERLEWVKEARVRLREDRDALTGEAFVVPADKTDLRATEKGRRGCKRRRLASSRYKHRCGPIARVRPQKAQKRLSEKANLLVQGHEIEVIPRLNNLSIVDPDDCNARKLDRRLSRLSSHEVSFVLTAH